MPANPRAPQTKAETQLLLEYRPFKESDFDPLARLVSKLWFRDASGDEAELLGATELCSHLLLHTWSCVAVANGEPRGVALVSRTGQQNQHDLWLSRRNSYGRKLRSLVGDASARNQLELIAKEAHVEGQLRSTGEPWADATIELLIVDPNLQGHGVGKRLLGDAKSHLVRAGARGFFLMTDDGCDYSFYDHLGFQRVYQGFASTPAGDTGVYAYAAKL